MFVLHVHVCIRGFGTLRYDALHFMDACNTAEERSNNQLKMKKEQLWKMDNKPLLKYQGVVVINVHTCI